MTTHGAHSEKGLRGRKTALKRRFLAARGLRESDLSAAVQQVLDDYVEVGAKRRALDDWFDQNGLVDDAGEPLAPTKLYIAVLNSEQRILLRLEELLSEQDDDDPFAHYRSREKQGDLSDLSDKELARRYLEEQE
jgi:hypothetical protein